MRQWRALPGSQESTANKMLQQSASKHTRDGDLDSAKSSADFYSNRNVLCGARGLSRLGIPTRGGVFLQEGISQTGSLK